MAWDGGTAERAGVVVDVVVPRARRALAVRWRRDAVVPPMNEGGGEVGPDHGEAEGPDDVGARRPIDAPAAPDSSSPPDGEPRALYDVFLSYSHGADDALAAALERGLERFAKPWYGRRRLNVFRDASSLSANPSLWATLAHQLDASDRLVVLCSPDSASSEWVGREVEHWLATKGPEGILLAVTDGDLAWDGDAGAFDPVRSTALHPSLVGQFDEEPYWVDLRFARAPGERTLGDPRFREAVAGLAASVLRLPKDELIGEDIRQQRRLVKVLGGGAAAVILLVVVAVGLFVVVRLTRGSLDQSESDRRALRLSTAADLERTAGRLDRALLLGAAAVSGRTIADGTGADGDSSPRQRDAVNAEAYGSLVRSVAAAGQVDRMLHIGCTVDPDPDPGCASSPRSLGAVAVSPDGSSVAAAEETGAIRNGDQPGRVFVWRDDGSGPAAPLELTDDPLGCVDEVRWLEGDALLTVEHLDGCFDPTRAPTRWGVDVARTRERLWDVGSGRDLSVCGRLEGVDIGGAAAVAPLSRSPLTVDPGGRFAAVTCAAVDDEIVVDATVVVLDAASLDVDGWPAMVDISSNPLGVSMSPSGRYLSSFTTAGMAELWDLEAITEPDESPVSLGKTLIEPGGLVFSVGPDGEEVVAVFRPQGATSGAGPDRVEVIDVHAAFADPASALLGTLVADGLSGSTGLAAGRLVVLGDDGRIHELQWATGAERILPRPEGSRRCADPQDRVEPSEGDGILLVTRMCSDPASNSVLVVDVATGVVRRQIDGSLVTPRLRGPFVLVEQPPSGSVEDGSDNPPSVELWEFGPDTPDGIQHWKEFAVTPVVAPGGDLLALVPMRLLSAPGTVDVWRLTASGPVGPTPLAGSSETWSAGFIDQHRLVGAGDLDSVVIWDLDKGAHEVVFEDEQPADDRPSALRRDGRVRAWSDDGTVVLTDLVTDEAWRVDDLGLRRSESIDYLALTPDGSTLVVGVQGGEDGDRSSERASVLVALTPAGGPAGDPMRVTGGYEAASGDGQRLLFLEAEGPSLVVREAPSYEVVSTLDVSSPHLADGVDGYAKYTLDGDGSRVAGVGTAGRVVLWSVEDERVLHCWTPAIGDLADVQLIGLAFDPDGSMLAVNLGDRSLRAFDLDAAASGPDCPAPVEGVEVRSRKIPSDVGARVSFSADGSQLAVDSMLFDVATLRSTSDPLRVPDWVRREDRFHQGSFFVDGPNGERYLVAERVGGGAAVRWRLDVPWLVDRACAVAGRDLTALEIALFDVGGSPGAECPG